MNNASIKSFFVYGTLKRDHLRGNLWPRKPVSVLPATVSGDLYDLGSYPAAASGTGCILGEVWEFHDADMPETCAVIDRIEGYDPGGKSNEYIRIVVQPTIFDEVGQSRTTIAWMYHCADEQRLKFARKIPAFIQFHGNSVAQWPDRLARVPRSFAEE